VFMVNFGFWVGSLCGDELRLMRSLVRNDQSILNSTSLTPIIPPVAFSVGWLIALVGVGAWGVSANRRWVVNVAATFGAIHFYTQWFDKLGPTPLSFLLGGLVMLVFALVLWGFNRRYVGKPG
ncbi:MAG: hypothetical protein ACREDY_27865, partial [Bradyrhizobium sp.]